MTLCPACSTPLSPPRSERCPVCSAILRVGEHVLPRAATLKLAQQVALTGYPWDAYDFVLRNFPRIGNTLSRRGRRTRASLTAEDVCLGLVELGRIHFGPRAAEAFDSLHLRRCEDIGKIVFSLGAADLLKIEASDRLEDFANLFDLRAALAPAPPPDDSD